ncbi:MAG: 3-deoxy-7-phosphoheptulonate synthase [Chthoniobacterales bacterium]
MTSTETSSSEAKPATLANASGRLENKRVLRIERLTPPTQIKEKLPANESQCDRIAEHRQIARDIIAGKDKRLLVVVGPCSIHDTGAALENADSLVKVANGEKYKAHIIKRDYLEKPRTTVGWKGLINDPHMDESYEMAEGIAIARKLLLDIVELGLPTATEFLDPIIPQYIADLISWAAIGARTTESQTHREMASGLSMPVGFKNGTDGSVQTAMDALLSSQSPHSFLGIDQSGYTSIVKTKGNPDAHIVLRGGRNGPNYEPKQIAEILEQVQKNGIPSSLVVDCSHANSNKDHNRQSIVWESILKQRADGQNAIVGAMLESNIHAGKQAVAKNREGLEYGISVTDACIDWETTEKLLRSI